MVTGESPGLLGALLHAHLPPTLFYCWLSALKHQHPTPKSGDLPATFSHCSSSHMSHGAWPVVSAQTHICGMSEQKMPVQGQLCSLPGGHGGLSHFWTGTLLRWFETETLTVIPAPSSPARRFLLGSPLRGPGEQQRVQSRTSCPAGAQMHS